MSAFRVLKKFSLRRQGNGSVLADDSPEQAELPLLGEYHEGHVYALTAINLTGVAAAIAGEAAELV